MKKKIGIALTSAVALVLALVLLLNPAATITAQAISLDHIETIKQEKAASNSGFLIVEVAPSAEDGTIGYYVANQEPVANWPEKAAAISGKAARTSAVNAVFQSLRDKGLLSGGDSTPLTDLGSYIEFYPWEAYPEEASPLSLNQAEEVEVSGSFTKVSGGDYEANIRYSLDTENGTALQVVSYFEYASETTPGDYYYSLDFTPIEAGSDLADGTPVYRGTLLTESSTESAEPEITEEEVLNSDGSEFPTEPQVTVGEPETETDGNTTRITTVKTTVSYAVEPIMWKYIDPLTGEEVVPPASGTDTDTETNTEEPSEPVEVVVAVRVTTTTVRETTVETTTLGICQYEGIVGQGLSLDLDEHYYTVSETADSVPSETRTESHCYRAEGLGFAEGENGSGYFRADIESYYYIGSGRGSYDFAQDPTGSYSGTISCDTVYYAGGFTNNNWFRNYALDCTETETFPVLVRSYSPSELTSRLTLLETADLIVVSSGLSGTAYQLPAALKSAIDEAVGQGTPLLTDSTMAGSLSPLTVGIASGG
ncbi:MAG: hypothetical protein MJ075_00895, partial [Oscillospiraceae bacterium]|nr:hypothetical protein [Oscillospiraceae bacterium]